MIHSIYMQAGLNVAGEPVSIETDGTVWRDADKSVVELKKVKAEYERLLKEKNDARISAIEHAKSLGFTDAMIAVMYPNLAVAGDVTE